MITDSVEAFRFVRSSVGPLLKDEMCRISPSNTGLMFTVALVPRRRRADGTLGKWRARPEYFGPFVTADEAYLHAAYWLAQFAEGAL